MFSINELKLLENSLISEYHLAKKDLDCDQDSYLKEIKDLTSKVRDLVLEELS